MKIFASLLFVLFSYNGISQTIQQVWKPLLQQEQLASYFEGMWESLGIKVEETGESITVTHKGDHFDLKTGIVESEVDYTVLLNQKNIKNMALHGADGIISEDESYRIMGALFTPFTRASLTHPMMNKSFQMKLAKIENHVHVYLNSPTNDTYKTHTLLFINKKWLVIDGIHGNAKRTFKLTPVQAVIYQKEAFAAQKGNSKKSWKKFKKFYLGWRNTVSVAK